MRRSSLALLPASVAALAVLVPPSAALSEVQGNFGGYTEQIPIDLPPGPGDVQPLIALTGPGEGRSA